MHTSAGPARTQFEALANSAPDAIFTIDEHSTILFANSAVARVFGYAPAELVGQPLTLLMPERHRPAHRAGIARYLRTRQKHIPWTGAELAGLTRDGREIPLEISFGEFVDDDGQRVFSGFARDLSERVLHQRELEEALRAKTELLESERRARQQAEQATTVRDEVLSVVSHDLRNPVSTIMMSASLLADRNIALDEAQQRKQAAIISKSAHRMSRLIQDLLDVARIEGGRLSVARKCEDAAALAQEACDAFRKLAEEKDQLLACDLERPLGMVMADRDRVIQVLANLMNNAVKFTPAGGRITVRGRRAVGGVRFEVADDGPGIAAEDRANLFARFWQKKNTAHLGAGLGLAICKGIVAAHGGRIWVDSTEGKGAVFAFEIPGAGCD